MVTPLYLFTQDYTMIVVFFGLQGLFAAGGIYGQNPSYLAERFPTEVRATASGFCYHQGAIFGGSDRADYHLLRRSIGISASPFRWRSAPWSAWSALLQPWRLVRKRAASN